jgi:3-deoxy-D-manno-octulosonic-acid transferase
MIGLYRILFPLGALLSSPYYLLRMARRGGYGEDWKQRMGRELPVGPHSPTLSRIWVQAVSVGEVRAIFPLLRDLSDSGEAEIYLTTTTSTGYRVARDLASGTGVQTGLFPLDWFPFSRRAWETIRPDLCLLTDSELWPEHLWQAQKRGIPTIVMNARLSDRSFRRYRFLKRLGLKFFPSIEAFLATSDLDGERLRALGVLPQKVLSLGNLKCDFAASKTITPSTHEALRRDLGLFSSDGAQPRILLGSSTWPGEEEFLLHTLEKLREGGEDWRLLLVPRHAERRNAIVALLKQQKLPWIQRSMTPGGDSSVGICLADTTGELSTFTQLVDLCFVGKSLFKPGGGQSPLEAAAAGVPIVCGPYMSNFHSITAALVANGAAVQGFRPEEVANELNRLARDEKRRREMGEKAREWLEGQRGAGQRVKAFIRQQLAAARASSEKE